jgi:hypothetical protein
MLRSNKPKASDLSPHYNYGAAAVKRWGAERMVVGYLLDTSN